MILVDAPTPLNRICDLESPWLPFLVQCRARRSKTVRNSAVLRDSSPDSYLLPGPSYVGSADRVRFACWRGSETPIGAPKTETCGLDRRTIRPAVGSQDCRPRRNHCYDPGHR